MWRALRLRPGEGDAEAGRHLSTWLATAASHRGGTPNKCPDREPRVTALALGVHGYFRSCPHTVLYSTSFLLHTSLPTPYSTLRTVCTVPTVPSCPPPPVFHLLWMGWWVGRQERQRKSVTPNTSQGRNTLSTNPWHTVRLSLSKPTSLRMPDTAGGQHNAGRDSCKRNRPFLQALT